ncbi:MAG: site-specific recombinase [Pseudomonadota bacterium]|nr:site-specific recombinase [Pseudomonadota bacterium]
MARKLTLEQRFDAALTLLAHADDDAQIGAFIGLVDLLRPKRPDRVDEAVDRLQRFGAYLQTQPELRVGLREALLRLVANRKSVRLFTDSGILANEGFFTGLWRRVGASILPEEQDRESLKDVVGLVFRKQSDYLWLQNVPDDAWLELMHAIDFRKARGTPPAQKILMHVLDGLQVMSYRITAIGLEPEIVHNYPAIERYESPFLMQNVEVRLFIEDRKNALSQKADPTMDDKHLQVLLQQCRDIVTRIRRQALIIGASVGLTHLLVRLTQNIERCALLLKLLEVKPEVDCNADRLRLLRALVEGENRKNSVRDLFMQTVQLLALRITGNAGKAGEAYITNSASEYFSLFRAAMGAGFLVALMAAVKLWLAHQPYAPLVEAFRFSAMYATGFVLMSIFHFSLATKQPAMTANRLARALEAPAQKGQDRLDNLAELIVRTLRSQFVAVLGNFVLSMPVAAAIAYAFYSNSGEHFIGLEKAEKLIHEIDPLHWTTWFWGALTGVWLFVCGLISGYYDNKAVYNRIPQRLQQLRSLRWLGVKRRERLAHFVEENLGAVAGSFFFGIMLGSTAALGKVTGLPIDTLHVTFSATNTMYALVAFDGQLPWSTLARCALGILVIGTMNLAVSFGLALNVAMRAQRVKFADTWPLLGKLLRRLFTTPAQFFLPPRSPRPPFVAPAVSDAEMIKSADKSEKGPETARGNVKAGGEGAKPGKK